MKGRIKIFVSDDYDIYTEEDLRNTLSEAVDDGDFDESFSEYLYDNYTAYEVYCMTEDEKVRIRKNFIGHLIDSYYQERYLTIDTNEVMPI